MPTPSVRVGGLVRPSTFSPQHTTAPVSRNAQFAICAAAMAMALVKSAGGTVLPATFAPQQTTVESCRSAQDA
jgi:hypothetical protein